ncbi:MAG: LytTR family transcriptional regulator [Clostridia bacterium]|nr:LytTR family transcriptional regulator [Clostridia bacterium]
MQKRLQQNVVRTILNFYSNDYDMFLSYLDDDVIWFGPREGQYISGKENLRLSLSHNTMRMRFAVDDIRTRILYSYRNIYSCLAAYRLTVMYPDGTSSVHSQHALFSLRHSGKSDTPEDWKCLFIHISDVIPQDEKTKNLPIQVPAPYVSPAPEPTKMLMFPQRDRVSCFIPQDDIVYAEGGKGACSFIHTGDGVYEVRLLLKEIEPMLPGYFYRCHSSYIVNLRRVIFVTGRYVILEGGTEIPIPAKRAAKIRADIESGMRAATAAAQ